VFYNIVGLDRLGVVKSFKKVDRVLGRLDFVSNDKQA
jgi:hypothetical protein